MNETQALNICGYFAKGLDAHFVIGENDYLFHRSEFEDTLAIHGPDGSVLLFAVADMSVSADGCLVIDLFDFQMRIDLEGCE